MANRLTLSTETLCVLINK